MKHRPSYHWYLKHSQSAVLHIVTLMVIVFLAISLISTSLLLPQEPHQQVAFLGAGGQRR